MAEDDDEIIISAEAVTTNIVLTDADSEAFRDKALPILRQHLFMLDDMPSEEEWEEELSIADRDKLLEMEVVASGEAFASLEDKWDTEDRIQETRARLLGRRLTSTRPSLIASTFPRRRTSSTPCPQRARS
ncbi:hypothetical protein [Aeromonas veronii]|uniref:hypothetical protein n=1 Tax=Aeromonas veronii TaxID=654 RepID=UPI001F0A6824|nr:hypothetical protein [Aeromonas veronii]